MPDQKAKAILNDIGTEELAPNCYQLVLFIVIKYQLLITRAKRHSLRRTIVCCSLNQLPCKTRKSPAY